MKKTFISAAVFIYSICVFAQSSNPYLESLINNVNADSLVSFVRILSGEDSVYISGTKSLIEQRVYNSNDLAANYVYEKLMSYNLDTYKEDYSEYGTNVYAIKEGSKYPDEYYFICAHYDGVTYHCADDNASGSATVLEAARLMSVLDFEYSLVFALWDEEEIGLIGSRKYANVAHDEDMLIKGVVNIDMIGWDSDDDGLVEIHSNDYPESLDIVDMMIEVNEDYEIGLSPTVQNPGTGASDHSSFWNAGYGSVLLIEGYWSGDFNPYYHSPDDRIEWFNIPYFHRAASLAIGTTASFAIIDETVGTEEFTASASQIEIICFPNPSREKTTIKYFLPDEYFVSISLINTLGQRMVLCENRLKLKGEHLFDFDTSDLTKGIYTIRFNAKKVVGADSNNGSSLNNNLVVIN